MKEPAAEKADDSRLTAAGPFYLAEKPLFCLKERYGGFVTCVCVKIGS